MKKLLINNTSKHFEAISNGGRYHIKARMKVDYDSINDFWGCREWVYYVLDLKTNRKIVLTKNGIPVLKNSYIKKKLFLNDIESIGVFSNALGELTK